MTGYAELQSEIRSTVERLAPGIHKLSFPVAGGEIQLNLKIEAGATALAIHFHGAVNRELRKVPQFPAFIPKIGKVHQISIPDPSMSLLDRPFNISWYAGHEGFDTQSILRETFAVVAESLGVESVIYFGNSGGGFAALYYSHCQPGSFAVVGNPQTAILAHHQAPISRYRTHCWPSLSKDADLVTATCSDLPALYGKGFENTVIYVQSLGDRSHYVNHMLPFAASIAGLPEARRFLLQCDFPGKLGHKASPHEYINWMRAIIQSPTSDIGQILNTLHSIREKEQGQSLSLPAGTAKSGTFDSIDISIAERLRKWRERASEKVQGVQA